MSIEASLPHHPAILIAGRYMFALIFVLSGVTHFTDIQGYVDLMHAAIPFREFWVLISGAVELAGAAMIVSNRYAKLGGWLIFIFLVPVTVVVHGEAMINAATPEIRGAQTSFFLKGVAMAGGALLISQLGVRQAEPEVAPPS